MQAPGQVQRGSGEGWEGSEGSGEGVGGFGAEPGHVQQGSGEGSTEGLGGFGAEPGQVQQGSREGSRKPWWKAKSSSTGFRRRFRGGFAAEPGHRVPEKVPAKV